MPHEDEGGGGGLSQEKACKILKDGQVNGEALTPPQERLMRSRCSGAGLQQAENGAVIDGHWHSNMLEVLTSTPEFEQVLASVT